MPSLPRIPSRPALRRTFFAAVLAASGGGAGAAALPAAASAANTPHLDARERAVIHRINLIRKAHHLQPLIAGGRLSQAADRHSKRQLQASTLAHQLPGEASATDRVATAARTHTVGEAVYFATRAAGSKAIVRAWMASPPHRALLLDPSFGRAGVGIRIGHGGVYATADVAAR
ncbi:MAG: CAP domain-containing protein [Solirubrobacteraceae bacterium]|nr:CAP domain-containing protein [Patulibacter sp.]